MDSEQAFLQIIPMIIIVAAAAIFVRIYRGSKRRGSVEAGLTPIFEEQAGGKFDMFNLTIPFVRHAIYDEFVVITTGKRYYQLNFDQIDRISIKRHLFSMGVTYHHNISDVPLELIVWSKNPERVKSFLVSKGVRA